MLNVTGNSIGCCDGFRRRSFLKVGVLGLGGLTLPQFLRLQAAASGQRKTTSVIFVELAGGPTHFETYDPKPDAPVEYRGPLGTIATQVPGVCFSELMVEQARVASKLAVIRSIHHDSSSHGTSSHLVQTGYYLRDRQNRENEMPCCGSITAKVRGPNATGVPAFVSMPRMMRFGTAAYLGKGVNPFVAEGDPNAPNYQVQNISLAQGLDLETVADRRTLLASLDRQRRFLDLAGAADALDDFGAQAFEMVAGERARQAFDIEQEPAGLRDCYGRNPTGQTFLLARRLVEAGVTFVTIRPEGSWDDHQQIARRMQEKAPAYDRGIAALIADLSARGLEKEVLVVAAGEFGRTPRVNRNAGRDHWGSVMSVLLAGGGLPMGQVIGASTPRGEIPADAPYRPENVLAMVYRHLGIDPQTTFADLAGRPRYALEERGLVHELL